MIYAEQRAALPLTEAQCVTTSDELAVCAGVIELNVHPRGEQPKSTLPLRT